MNKFIGIGFIGKKGIELKFTPGKGTAVATYSLSIPRQFSKDGNKEYDFLNMVTWNKQAEWLANNQDKIKKIAVEGKIQTRSYDKKDGSKAYITEIVTDNIEVVEWATSAPSGIANNENISNYREIEDEMTPVDDSDIPF